MQPRLLVRELACKLRQNGYPTVTDAQVNHALRRLQKVVPRVHKTQAGWKLLPEDAVKPQN